MKVAARNKLTTSNTRQLEPVTTLQPTVEQTILEVVEGKGKIRFAPPSAHDNKTTSKWRRKLGNRLKRKEASSTMWHEVEAK